MKIFKSTSFLLAMFLLFGMNVEASSPRVVVTESGEVQVSNVGNNIVGMEITLELSSGSFSNNAFIPTNSTSYTFEKVSGSKITIYSTGQEDLAGSGTVILGKIQTTSGATFTSGTTINLVGQSLAKTIYANVPVVNEMSTGNSSGSTSGTTTNSGTTSGSSTSNDAEDSSLEEDESVDELVDLEEDDEVEKEEIYGDDYVNNNQGTSYSEEDKGSLYLWLFLLFIVLTGGGIILYINKPKDNKPKDNEPKNDDHRMDEIIDEMPLAQKEYNDLYVNAEYEGTDMTQYQEW